MKFKVKHAIELGHLQEELQWGSQNEVYKSCHGSHMAAAGTLISVQSVRGRIGLLQLKFHVDRSICLPSTETFRFDLEYTPYLPLPAC